MWRPGREGGWLVQASPVLTCLASVTFVLKHRKVARASRTPALHSARDPAWRSRGSVTAPRGPGLLFLAVSPPHLLRSFHTSRLPALCCPSVTRALFLPTPPSPRSASSSTAPRSPQVSPGLPGEQATAAPSTFVTASQHTTWCVGASGDIC